MRYPQGGGLTAERRAFREHIRLQAAGLFGSGQGNAAVARELRVSVRSVQRWRRAWEEGGERALASKGPLSRPRFSKALVAVLEREPCADTARFASVGSDELLGLITALLPLGTAGVVACTAPVNDAVVVPLMLALHKGLSEGLSLAEALCDARAALPGDALHQATGWAFSAFGAA
jgi:transposase-like protein